MRILCSCCGDNHIKVEDTNYSEEFLPYLCKWGWSWQISKGQNRYYCRECTDYIKTKEPICLTCGKIGKANHSQCDEGLDFLKSLGMDYEEPLDEGVWKFLE